MTKAALTGLWIAAAVAAAEPSVADAGPADAGRVSVDAGRPAVDAGNDAGSLGTPGVWPDSAVPTDVIDTALQNGEFTGFLKAVAEAGLAETLKGAGPYTVLAPNDAAFAAFAKKSKGKEWQKLLADKERLRRVVLLHVVPGRLSKADLERLKAGDQLPTLLSGKKVKLGKKKDRLTFDKATLVKADVEASNGVLHVVDTVLTP